MSTNDEHREEELYSRAIATKRRIYGVEYRVALPFDAIPERAIGLRVEAATVTPASSSADGTIQQQASESAYKRRRTDSAAAARGSCSSENECRVAKGSGAAAAGGGSSRSVSDNNETASSEQRAALGTDVTLDNLCPTARWYVQLDLNEKLIPSICEHCYAITCICCVRRE